MGEDGWQRNKEQSLIIEPVEQEVVGKSGGEEGECVGRPDTRRKR